LTLGPVDKHHRMRTLVVLALLVGLVGCALDVNVVHSPGALILPGSGILVDLEFDLIDLASTFRLELKEAAPLGSFVLQRSKLVEY
jgi:hypothetical protein